METSRVNFFDTSAYVKFLLPEINEPGTDKLVKFRERNHNFYVSSFCAVEALGVLASKWKRDRIEFSNYVVALDRFKMHVEQKRVIILESSPFSDDCYDDAHEVVERHAVDFIDALQLVGISRGDFSRVVGTMELLFITADKNLASAARSEGIQVWYCLEDPINIGL